MASVGASNVEEGRKLRKGRRTALGREMLSSIRKEVRNRKERENEEKGDSRSDYNNFIEYNRCRKRKADGTVSMENRTKVHGIISSTESGNPTQAVAYFT